MRVIKIITCKDCPFLSDSLIVIISSEGKKSIHKCKKLGIELPTFPAIHPDCPLEEDKIIVHITEQLTGDNRIIHDAYSDDDRVEFIYD